MVTTNKQQYILKVDRRERAALNTQSCDARGRRYGHTRTTFQFFRTQNYKLQITHKTSALFWALSLIENVNQLECDQEDGQTSDHAI